MNIKALFTDDKAVSPVIGVILMVAITVILAAVIGAFVLDIGGSQESAPQADWSWSNDVEDISSTSAALDNDGNWDQFEVGIIELSHGGGDTVNNPNQISVVNDDSAVIGGSGDSYTAGSDIGFVVVVDDGATVGSETVDSADVNEDQLGASGDHLYTSDELSGELELVWESSDGSQSNTISSHSYGFDLSYDDS